MQRVISANFQELTPPIKLRAISAAPTPNKDTDAAQPAGGATELPSPELLVGGVSGLCGRAVKLKHTTGLQCQSWTELRANTDAQMEQ